jgi:hypothetical protein
LGHSRRGWGRDTVRTEATSKTDDAATIGPRETRRLGVERGAVSITETRERRMKNVELAAVALVAVCVVAATAGGDRRVRDSR